MLPNVLQYPIALFGALRAGLTVVNTNPLYTARELEHQLTDSGAKAILILENFAHTLEQVIERTSSSTSSITGVGDQLGWPKSAIVNLVVRHVRKQVPPYELPGALRFNDALEQGQFLPFEPVTTTHDDIAFLQYTGGTTGVAKGAMLTHRNMVANVLQAGAWLGTAGAARRGHDHHAAAAVSHLRAHRESDRVHPVRRAQRAHRQPARFPGVREGAALLALQLHQRREHAVQRAAEHAGIRRARLQRSCASRLGGGMAVQRSVAEHWQRVTGNVLTQAWGLTETSPAACINPFALTEFNGSIGLPIPSTEITIRNDEGRELPIGEVGEICVRGPQVMLGYWNRPDETAQVMVGDWLRTGDIGRIDDDGFVFIEDRKKDMILVSGFNVYPNEIESVVAAHPGVLEVAAVAQDDERSGEAVALFVVRKDPNLTEQQLIDYCRGELTGYKVPRHVYFRKELPKTNVGKILRRELRDELQEESG